MSTIDYDSAIKRLHDADEGSLTLDALVARALGYGNPGWISPAEPLIRRGRTRSWELVPPFTQAHVVSELLERTEGLETRADPEVADLDLVPIRRCIAVLESRRDKARAEASRFGWPHTTSRTPFAHERPSLVDRTVELEKAVAELQQRVRHKL